MMLWIWIIILLVMILVMIVLLYANKYAANRVKIKQIEIRTKKIKGELTVVHISDLHFYKKMNESRLENIHRTVDKIYSETLPDFVCITGDFLGRNDGIPVLRPFLAKLKSKYGVYAVLGNHDIHEYNLAHLFQTLFHKVDKKPADTEGLLDALKEYGVKTLRDETVRFHAGSVPVTLFGADHETGKSADASGVTIKDDASFHMVISHYPDILKNIKGRVDLMLAGHTHGGQVTLFGMPIMTRSKIRGKTVRGLSFHDGTASYVSHGAGVSWMFPFRLFAEAEIAVITLKEEA